MEAEKIREEITSARNELLELTMLRSAHEADVPFAWVTGDSV